MLRNVAFFSDFQPDLMSPQSTADILTVVSDRNGSAFNRCGATWVVALDIQDFWQGLACWPSSQS